jgi:hypothetical protein
MSCLKHKEKFLDTIRKICELLSMKLCTNALVIVSAQLSTLVMVPAQLSTHSDSVDSRGRFTRYKLDRITKHPDNLLATVFNNHALHCYQLGEHSTFCQSPCQRIQHSVRSKGGSYWQVGKGVWQTQSWSTEQQRGENWVTVMFC